MKQNPKATIKRGITVVEMLVVLSMLAILTAAVVPVISHYLPGVQLNGTARVLVGNLRVAQEKAVTEQNQYLVRFAPTASPPSYQLIRIYNSTEEIQQTVTLANNETLTLENSITNNQIVFSPDGGPSSSGNITLGLNGSQKIINVSPAGFINYSAASRRVSPKGKFVFKRVFNPLIIKIE